MFYLKIYIFIFSLSNHSLIFFRHSSWS